MSEHTPTPWRVFKTTDGRKLVGVGAQDGQGILDSGYGVWAWDDAEGIANAELVVKAVNSHEAMVKALETARTALCGFLDSSPSIQRKRDRAIDEIDRTLTLIAPRDK